jgi:hypothetical protein
MIRKTPRRFTILHFSQIFLTLGLTFIAASNRFDDLTAVRIELGKLHADSGSADEPDDCVPEGRGNAGADLSTIVEADPKQSAR